MNWLSSDRGALVQVDPGCDCNVPNCARKVSVEDLFETLADPSCHFRFKGKLFLCEGFELVGELGSESWEVLLLDPLVSLSVRATVVKSRVGDGDPA